MTTKLELNWDSSLETITTRVIKLNIFIKIFFIFFCYYLFNFFSKLYLSLTLICFFFWRKKNKVRHILIIFALISHLFPSFLEEEKNVTLSCLTWWWNISLIVIKIIFYLMSILYIHFYDYRSQKQCIICFLPLIFNCELIIMYFSSNKYVSQYFIRLW